MPSTALPAETVADEFATFPAAVSDNTRATIIGPHAGLHRFDEADEKEDISLGDYDPDNDTAYDWPARTTGSVVDQDFAKLFVEDGLLKYFEDQVGSDSTITVPSPYKNRIESDTVNWKDNGDAFPRDAVLLDRDVTVGDIIDVIGTVGVNTFTKRTTVAGFVADTVAAVTGAAAADGSNETTQILATGFSQTGGCTNQIEITAADGSAYNGISTGDISETYVVTVTQAPTIPGDATTALLDVVSLSGNDNDTNVSPAAYGAATSIGARGLTVTWDDTGVPGTCSVDDDFQVGQEFTITVDQAYTTGVAASAGTYTGTIDTTYIIECTLGGRFTDATDPQVTITTTTGTDASGPTTVATAAAVTTVGSLGITIVFTGYSGLVFGDKWTIPATAASEGDIRTLILGDNLDDGVLTATDLLVKIYIEKTFQVERKRTSTPGVFNYETDADQITVNEGMEAYDSTWTDAGEEQPLPVVEGELFAEYREWLPTNVGDILSVVSLEELEELMSTDSDNPLGYAGSKALVGANGSAVFLVAISDPEDTTAWEDAIEVIKNVPGVYYMVPLTTDSVFLELFKDHAIAQSEPEEGAARVLWVNLVANETSPIVTENTTTDEEVALATTEDDPDETGTQFTLFTCTTANAKFVTKGVRAGDTVRYLYTTDGWGDTVFSTFTVASVVNEDVLILEDGTDVEISVASKFEIHRNNTNSEITDDLIAQAAVYDHKLVRATFPDVVDSLPGYFLNAGLAGAISGARSNQGFKNVELLGFTDLSRATDFLSPGNLIRLSRNRVWVVTKDSFGTVFSKSAVTTADPDEDPLEDTEEMVVRNKHSMDFLAVASVADLLGTTNLTSGTVSLVRSRINGSFASLRVNGLNSRLGPTLITHSIDELAIHSILKDRLVLTMTYTLPAPFNTLEVSSTVVL